MDASILLLEDVFGLPAGMWLACWDVACLLGCGLPYLLSVLPAVGARPTVHVGCARLAYKGVCGEPLMTCVLPRHGGGWGEGRGGGSPCHVQYILVLPDGQQVRQGEGVSEAPHP